MHHLLHACRCGIRVHLREGEVRYIDGNPDHPLNKGVICAKGASGAMKQYSPARLTKPLVRKPGSMIYACIKFLQEWASPLTLVNYDPVLWTDRPPPHCCRDGHA